MTTRRKFIKTLSIATAGALLTKPLPSQNPELKPLRLGIIGTGDRGLGMARVAKDIPGMEVTALCDVLPFRLEQALPWIGEKTKTYADYKALLDDQTVDAVLIATPFNLHAQMLLDALDAGKHVYCEKTMCYGIEPALTAARKARASKKIVQTGHQYRSSRLYHEVVKQVNAGLIGEVALIECQWNRNGDWRRPVPDPALERQINWRMYREYSGGLVAELCSHQLDFANWLLDANPLKISGFGSIDYWKDGRETYDNVHLLMEYPGGVKAGFTCLTTNAREGYQVKIAGKKGTVVIGMDQAWVYSEDTIRPSETGTLVDGVSGATRDYGGRGVGRSLDIVHLDPSMQALLDFRENIFQNTQPLSNAETGARVSVAVQLALNAMDGNRVEFWKKEFDLE